VAYEEESRRSRAAAIGFVSGLRAESFEEMLASLAPAAPKLPDTAGGLDRLSPQKRALLLQRLREKSRK
jgi:hypothetical protein